MKRHANPKPSKAGVAHLRRVTREAFPDHTIELCSHGDLGGHRAPRDHTLAFRLVDSRGKYRSNVIWIMPESLTSWSADQVRRTVDRSNGR